MDSDVRTGPGWQNTGTPPSAATQPVLLISAGVGATPVRSCCAVVARQ